ncbi:MAG: hypothetical protein H6734_27950 [Alphaproteobacteria bacterium]|nr:hypothetical protein [Alphaproteobacteria bacterium]
MGIADPGGTTYNPSIGFAIVDFSDRLIRFLDAGCAVVAPELDTSAYATNPRGVAWSEPLQEYAVVDPGSDELYYVDPSGAVTGSCDLLSAGSGSASGVAWDPIGQRYVVSDDGNSRIYFVNPTVRGGGTCSVASNFSTANLGLNSPIEVGTDAAGHVLFTRGGGVSSVYVTTQGGALLQEIVLDSTIDDIQGIVTDPNAPGELFLLESQDDDLLHVDARGSSSQVCTNVGGNIPRGLEYVESTNQFLVLDADQDQIQFVNAQSCVMQRTIPLQALGVTGSEDLTYLPASNEIVVSDLGSKDLVFVDAVSGALTSRCDISGLGLTTARGLTALPDLDLVAVADGNTHSWALLDASCEIVHARSIDVLSGSDTNNHDPQALAWSPSSGRFLVRDGRLIAVSDLEGRPGFHFDANGLGLAATGMAVDPVDPAAFWLLSNRTIHRVQLPKLAEDLGISGRFASASATIYLWDRGEGRVTGTALVGGDTLPLFGQLSAAGGSLTVGTITSGGAPLVVPVTVSPDLSTVTAPPPIGVLTRQ